MQIACPSCGKLYKIADEKLKTSGIKVKCTKCEHVFEVRSQAASNLYRIRTPAGKELDPQPLKDIIEKIEAGEYDAGHQMAGPGMPFTGLSEHPDLKDVNVPAAKGGDDDLFGPSGSETGGGDDDPFGDAAASKNDEDDLFGDDEPAAPAKGGKKASTADDDLFGDDDEPAAPARPAGGKAAASDDLFGDGDDLFGEDEPKPAKAAPKKSAPAADPFADDEDEPKPAAKGQAKESKNSALDDLFADHDDDDDSSGGYTAETKGSEGVGEGDFEMDGEDTAKYDEDIEKQVKTSFGEDVFENDQPVVDEDLITSASQFKPKRKKGPIIGAAVAVTVVAIVAVLLFVTPGALLNIPGVGDGVLDIHKRLKTRFYADQVALTQRALIAKVRQDYSSQAIRDTLTPLRAILAVKPNDKKAAMDFYRVGMAGVLFGVVKSDDLAAPASAAPAAKVPGYALKGDVERVSGITKDFGEEMQIAQLWAYLKTKQYDQALTFATAISVPADGSPEAAQKALVKFAVMGRAEAEYGDPATAVIYFQQASEAMPTNAIVRIMAADVLWQKQKKMVEARETLTSLADELGKQGATVERGLINRSLAELALIDEDFVTAMQMAQAASEALPDDLHATLVLARTYFANREFVKDLIKITDTEKVYPDTYELVVERARAQAALAKHEEAEKSYREAIKLSTSSKEAPIMLAKMLIGLNRGSDATPLLDDMALRYPTDPFVLRAVAQMRLDKGDYESARKDYETILRVSADDPEALNGLGEYYLRQGVLDKAADYFLRLRGGDPSGKRGALRLGEIYLRRNNLQASQELFEFMLAEDDKNPEVYLSLARIEVINKNWDKADEFLDSAINFSPLMAEAYYLKAKGARAREQLEVAVTLLQKAIEIRSEIPYRTELAEVYYQSALPGAAIEQYKLILEKNPDHLPSLWQVARAEVQLNQEKRALETLDRIQKLTPKDPDIFATRADIYLRQQKPQDAIKEARKALPFGSKFGPLHVVLGRAYLDNLEYSSAVVTLQKAVSLAKRDPLARFYMGFAQKSLRNMGAAKQEFELALKLGLPEDLAGTAKVELDSMKIQ